MSPDMLNAILFGVVCYALYEQGADDVAMWLIVVAVAWRLLA